ncbi:MAG: tRNA pseudouridine(13) synthase TruD [Candidatus Aenigmatarchaeota archaeon]
MYKRWLRSKGIGGLLKEPEDFIVKEIVDKSFFRKFTRTDNGVKPIDGKYTFFLLKKKNMTTKNAIKKISDFYSVNEDNFGYAGLKDKFAVTWQYMTTKADVSNAKIGDIDVEVIGKTDKRLSIGNLIGNEFTITLHGCRTENLEKILEELKQRGMPNYFGSQRFGRNENNHMIGRCIVKKNFGKALKMINKNSKAEYRNIRYVPKDLLRFFIHAYQSWIFNEILSQSIRKKKALKEIEIIGYNKKVIGNEIVKKEKISPKDFRVDAIHISCSGTKRIAFIKPGVRYDVNGKDVKLCFTLPKGSYATVLLAELGAMADR